MCVYICTYNERQREVRVEGDKQHEYGGDEVVDGGGAGVRGAGYRDDGQHSRQGPAYILQHTQ